MFSITITAASTIKPKSTAPSEIKFAGIPTWIIPTKAAQRPSGITIATMTAPLKLAKNAYNTINTSTTPTTSVC